MSTQFEALCKSDCSEGRDYPQSYPSKKRRKNQVAIMRSEIVEAPLLDIVFAAERQSGIELMNNKTPTSIRLPDDLWDPYVLQTREEVLDEEKKEVQKQVKDITKNIRKHLALDNVHEIIRISIGEDGENESRSTALGSSITDMIDIFQQRASSLGRKNLKDKRAKKMTYFIKHSLMRVQEFLNHDKKGPGGSKFAAYCHRMFGEIAWGPREIPLFLQLGKAVTAPRPKLYVDHGPQILANFNAVLI